MGQLTYTSLFLLPLLLVCSGHRLLCDTENIGGGTADDMYVCMYGHTYSKSMDQPGKVARPAHGQLNREK